PATATQPAMAVWAPIRTLWPTCTWLSRRTSSSSTVSSMAPRSMVVLAPISQSSPTTTPPSCGTLIQRPSCMARPKPSAPSTAPGWIRTRAPSRTRATRVTRATRTQPGPTSQSSPITQPGPITAPAPIRLRAPMLACGPTWASAATSASAATTALAWMPAGASGRVSNRAAMRAKAEYGSRATRQGTGQWAASASARTTAAAAVSASSRRYFGLARKLSWPGPAPPRVPTPVIAVVPSPRSSRPNRAARSDRAWACSRAGKAASSEGTAEGELQALDPVAALVLQGHGVADRDRAHRRLPGQRETGRDAQGLGLPVVVTQVDVADVDEGRQPRRRGVEQGREVELQVADRLQRTAQRLPVVAAGEGVGRADRVGLEAAHRVRAADVVVAEERQAALGGAGDDVALGVEGAAVEFVGVAEAVAVADLGTDLHHQPVAQRQVLLVAVVELVVLEVGAGQGNLGIDAVVAATGRHQEIVAGI